MSHEYIVSLTTLKCMQNVALIAEWVEVRVLWSEKPGTTGSPPRKELLMLKLY